MDIVRIFLEIHFLRAECEFVHPLTGTAEMKFTTVRYFGSASPSLGSLIPRLSNMSAIRSGMLRLVSMGRTLPPGAISKFRCLRVGS